MKCAGTEFQYSTPLTTTELYNTLFQLFIFSNAECYLSMSDLVNWFSFDLVLICNDTFPFIFTTDAAGITYDNGFCVIGNIDTGR